MERDIKPTYDELESYVENLQKQLADAQATIAALQDERDGWVRSREHYYQLWMRATDERDEMRKERDEFEKELDLFMSLLRDVFLLAGGSEQSQIVNVDVADRLQQLAGKIGLSRVTVWSEKIGDVRKSLRININRQIATEAALLAMAEVR